MRRSVGGKGVRRLAGYFIVHYTIWLAFVKSFCRPVLGNYVPPKNVRSRAMRILAETMSAFFQRRPLVTVVEADLKRAPMHRVAQPAYDPVALE